MRREDQGAEELDGGGMVVDKTPSPAKKKRKDSGKETESRTTTAGSGCIRFKRQMQTIPMFFVL